jgi:hypothetical protein
MISASQLADCRGVASGVSAGGEKARPMHDMIDRRVRAFLLQGLACSPTGAHGGRLFVRETRIDTGFELAKVPVLQGIMKLSRPALATVGLGTRTW